MLFEDKVLKRILSPKTGGNSGIWSKIHKEELFISYPVNIAKIIVIYIYMYTHTELVLPVCCNTKWISLLRC
jgi:hypothetical protein